MPLSTVVRAARRLTANHEPHLLGVADLHAGGRRTFHGNVCGGDGRPRGQCAHVTPTRGSVPHASPGSSAFR